MSAPSATSRSRPPGRTRVELRRTVVAFAALLTIVSLLFGGLGGLGGAADAQDGSNTTVPAADVTTTSAEAAAPAPSSTSGASTDGTGTAGPAADGTATDTAGVPAITLVSQSPWVQPKGDQFELRMRITGAPADAEITFGLHAVIDNGRNRFLDTIRAPDTLGRPDPTYTLPLANLETTDGVTTARFAVDNDRAPLLGFKLEKPGVYPLDVQVREPGGDVLARMVTHIVRLRPASAANAPIAVAIVVPLHAPVAHRADGTIDLGDRRDDLTATIRALAAHPEVPVTVAPTPETIAALAESGAVTGDELKAVADERDLVASPYVPVDVGRWIAAGLDAALIHQDDVGADVLTQRFGKPAVARTALLRREVTGEALARLRDGGAEQVVIPDAMLFPLPADFRYTLTRTFEIEGPTGVFTRAVAADAVLAGHLTDSSDPVLNAHHALADIAVLEGEEPAYARGVVLQLPDGAPAEFLDTLLSALDRTPDGGPDDAAATGRAMFVPTTIDGLFAYAEPAGARGGQAFNPAGTRAEPTLVRPWLPIEGPDLGSYPRQLALAEASLASYASLFPEGDLRLEPLRHLLLLSGSDDFDARRKQDQLDAAVGTVEEVSSWVHLPDQAQVTLAAVDGRMPLIVENRGPVALRVTLALTSDKLDFPDGRDQIVVLEPGQNRIDLKVRARTSGVFQVNTTITSPDGAIPLGTTKFNIRSTVVSGLGAGISIGAGFFLAVWWARHIHRERRRRRAGAVGPPPTAPRPDREPAPV